MKQKLEHLRNEFSEVRLKGLAFFVYEPLFSRSCYCCFVSSSCLSCWSWSLVVDFFFGNFFEQFFFLVFPSSAVNFPLSVHPPRLCLLLLLVRRQRVCPSTKKLRARSRARRSDMHCRWIADAVVQQRHISTRLVQQPLQLLRCCRSQCSQKVFRQATVHAQF